MGIPGWSGNGSGGADARGNAGAVSGVLVAGGGADVRAALLDGSWGLSLGVEPNEPCGTLVLFASNAAGTPGAALTPADPSAPNRYTTETVDSGARPARTMRNWFSLRSIGIEWRRVRPSWSSVSRYTAGTTSSSTYHLVDKDSGGGEAASAGRPLLGRVSVWSCSTTNDASRCTRSSR